MKVIVDNQVRGPARDALLEFERTIMDHGGAERVKNRFLFISGIIWRLLKHPSHDAVVKSLGKKDYFTILMGPKYNKCFPYFLYSRKRSVYIFDAWPHRHDELVTFIRKSRVDPVFFSSLDAAKMVQKRVAARCVWIPEAVDPPCYRYREYGNRDIDVLQFGRRYDRYHERIAPALERGGFTYRYEKKRGRVVFPEREGFIDGLSRSLISICFPLSITDKERSGAVSTMTMRYLQSMASKCLIVGIRPREMKKLFDYNPLIEVDTRDPAGQILQILGDYEKYIPLIERNYRCVTVHHTWKKRWKKMLCHLSCFESPPVSG